MPHTQGQPQRTTLPPIRLAQNATYQAESRAAFATTAGKVSARSGSAGGGSTTDAAMWGLNSASQVERTTATARETSAHEPVWSSVRSDNKRPSSPSSSTCTFPPTLDKFARCRSDCVVVPFAPTSAISPKRSRTSAGEGQVLSPPTSKAGWASHSASKAEIKFVSPTCRPS